MTFGGKGSTQQVFPLEGRIGGVLKITTATNCTPSGHIVQSRGIEPDCVVDLQFPELFVNDGAQNISEEGRDYLKKLRLEILCQEHGVEKVMPIWNQGDRQLAAATAVLMEQNSSKDDANIS